MRCGEAISLSFHRPQRNKFLRAVFLLRALFLTILTASTLVACGIAPQPQASVGKSTPTIEQLRQVSAQAGDSVPQQPLAGKIILPNPKLIRCQAPACPPTFSDTTEAGAIYPWQVLVDYNQGTVIGLIAFYDKPVSFNDVAAILKARYGKTGYESGGDHPGMGWRVEPEKFVIQLSESDRMGMVQVIYLTFGPSHPTYADLHEDSK